MLLNEEGCSYIKFQSAKSQMKTLKAFAFNITWKYAR